jgi:hypothetical protein
MLWAAFMPVSQSLEQLVRFRGEVSEALRRLEQGMQA